MIRVLLVDQDERVRYGWQMRLALEPDIEVVGMAGEMATAVYVAAIARPHVILFDAAVPGTNIPGNIANLHRAAPDSAIIVVTVYDSAHNKGHALRGGAVAFISKQANFDQLLALIREHGGAD